MTNKQKTLILASGSPRRKEILEREGIIFTVIKAVGEEKSSCKKEADYVSELALNKAQEVLERLEPDFEGFILSADTIVSYGGEILGKPGNPEKALEMLNKISGKRHSVYTGVCIIRKEKDGVVTKTFAEKTDVYVDRLSDREINEYIETGECLDKAGAYAIQGIFSKYINRIEGDYDNVVGLPYSKVKEELKKLGFFK